MRRFIDEKISVKLVEVAKSIDCHNMHQVLLKSVKDLGGRETAILHRYQELLDTVDLTQRGRAVSTAHTGEPATQGLIACMLTCSYNRIELFFLMSLLHTLLLLGTYPVYIRTCSYQQ